MPTSIHNQITPILLILEEEKPKTLLDVGCGMGKYGVLIREYVPSVERLDAIEIFEPYIRDLHRAVYDHIYIGDIRTEKLDDYEMYLMADVIEHMPLEDGIALLKRLPGMKIVATPKVFQPSEAHNGNENERHLSVWTVETFAINFPNCSVMELETSWVGILPRMTRHENM